jgi:hypothetical protein
MVSQLFPVLLVNRRALRLILIRVLPAASNDVSPAQTRETATKLS